MLGLYASTHSKRYAVVRNQMLRFYIKILKNYLQYICMNEHNISKYLPLR